MIGLLQGLFQGLAPGIMYAIGALSMVGLAPRELRAPAGPNWGQTGQVGANALRPGPAGPVLDSPTLFQSLY